MKHLLFITSCLFLIAAIAPASAYDLLADYSNEPATTGGGYALAKLAPTTANSWGNITRIYAEGSFGRTYDGITAYNDYPVLLKTTSCSGAQVGTALFTMTLNNASPANDALYPGSIVEFKDINVSITTDTDLFVCNGTLGLGSSLGSVNTATNNTAPSVVNILYFASSAGHLSAAHYQTYSGTEAIVPVADFNGTPLSGQVPLYVAFQDNSTGGPTSYNWTVEPPNGLIGNESSSAYPTIVFTEAGNYTITHCVENAWFSDCEEKTDYIWAYGSNATATTTFWAVDPLGHRVYGSAISLQDVQNTSWTNTSSPSGGVATITSLFGHTINGYATAAGYNDGETLGITADGVSGGIILMTPTNITNVSAGYVTLYVYAKESVGNAPISGAYINLAYKEGGSTRNDGSTTNTEGVASFVVPNNTLIYVYGEKVGYERVSTTKDSGSGSGGDAAVSVILYMTNQYVTPTITATTGPGGTVPVTVDPRTPQEKESDIALILIDYGDMLVMFFIALTIIGGVKMIMK